MKEKGKKVLVMTNHADDIYCFRKEVIDRLYKEGYKIIISCPYGEKMELLKDIDYEYDNPNIDRRGINPIADFKLFVHYIKLFRKYKPDISLNYTIKPNIYGSIAAQFTNVKYINNITGLGSVLSRGRILQSFILILLRFALRKSKCVFFQNEVNMKLAIEKKIVNKNYKLIPGSGVNTERFPLQEYPENDDIVIFNYIGRVLKEKGVDDYIEAAKQIKEKGIKAQFNIIGFIEPTEKHYENDFEELEKEDIIKYCGEQKDVKPFIKKAHAIIHPSTYGEGMSNVLLENASSGRPIITTDNPGCRETVENNVTGYIYSGGNVQELVETIQKFVKLTNEKKKTMGLKGREKVSKEFSRDIVVNEYLKAIEK